MYDLDSLLDKNMKIINDQEVNNSITSSHEEVVQVNLYIGKVLPPWASIVNKVKKLAINPKTLNQH